MHERKERIKKKKKKMKKRFRENNIFLCFIVVKARVCWFCVLKNVCSMINSRKKNANYGFFFHFFRALCSFNLTKFYKYFYKTYLIILRVVHFHFFHFFSSSSFSSEQKSSLNTLIFIFPFGCFTLACVHVFARVKV